MRVGIYRTGSTETLVHSRKDNTNINFEASKFHRQILSLKKPSTSLYKADAVIAQPAAIARPAATAASAATAAAAAAAADEEEGEEGEDGEMRRRKKRVK